MEPSDLKPEMICSTNLQQAVQIGDLCFPSEHDRKSFRSSFDRFINGARLDTSISSSNPAYSLHQMLFRLDGKACAFGGLYRHMQDNRCFWLDWLAVHPDYRRHRIGSTIVDNIARICNLLGAVELKVYTDRDNNSGTLKFYEFMGFRPTGEELFDGVACLVLARRL